jgi:hypothetical protein
MKTIVLNKPNITDFASERNDLLEKSNTDWVLFLDSDETISNFQFPISNQFSNYQFSRKNYFLGQYVGTDKIIRLVKKGTGKFVREVHEVWLPKKSHLRGVMFDTYIIHNTADSLKDYVDKINNYSTLHAKANLKEGKRSTIFKIIFFPIGKFFVTLIKSKHFVFSIMQSLHSYLSWTKLYFLQH